ncbi:myb/SANT-like DNA-binding domain-containing protein 4 [Lates japonicus]|uniref:Myb/SANT-like DNA-binding domain-containing protein 4 n=1 Tax=Lates japonicus TaxID=270547 RepID=A0AAD3RIY8_LATJO|nr:myb/SANT-like DNA-binding domain-containing protein 4 [Lates japonicus]
MKIVFLRCCFDCGTSVCVRNNPESFQPVMPLCLCKPTWQQSSPENKGGKLRKSCHNNPLYLSSSLCFSLCISGVFCPLLAAKLDFLQVKHLKRKRKSNYSVRETQTLIREIHKRRDVLFSRQQNTAINELEKTGHGREVATLSNSLGEAKL